jgi:hypothetical protein
MMRIGKMRTERMKQGGLGQGLEGYDNGEDKGEDLEDDDGEDENGEDKDKNVNKDLQDKDREDKDDNEEEEKDGEDKDEDGVDKDGEDEDSNRDIKNENGEVLGRTREKNTRIGRKRMGGQELERQLDTKALMVIGSLCPISVEGVIRGLKWGTGPKGAKALSSHHIWTFILPARP